MNRGLFFLLLVIGSNNSFATHTAVKSTTKTACNTLQSAQLLLGQWQSNSEKVQISEHWQYI
ncbi:MAG: hypothetical protein HRT35_30840, partial [Algicola sp.]|nr:hypothetical protein [Algicola sp.]